MSRDARRDFGHLYQRGETWWIRYSVGGRRYRESSKSTDRAVAEKLLTRRETELDVGAYTAPDVKRTTLADLAAIIRADYRVRGLRSVDRVDAAFQHLEAAFGGARATAVTTDRVAAYAAARLDAGAAEGTVWNELKALRRAFHLALAAGRVAKVPTFPTLKNGGVRTGFFDEADVCAVLAALAPPLQPPLAFAYYTGWRVPSEVLTRQWSHVDFDAGLVRLEPGETKSGEGRTFPFSALPPLEALLVAQRAHTEACERELGCVIPWVFHRQGKPIRYFDKAWRSALDRAAHTERNGLRVVVRPQLVGRVPHDLRRTAVRNLERAGVSRSVAMKLTGHETEEVYRRYAIAPEQDLREGVAKLAWLAGRGTSGAHSGRRHTGTA